MSYTVTYRRASPAVSHNWKSNFEYYDQVEWEWQNLHRATVIMFWVPRILPAFPAFTTNIEFGLYIAQRPEVIVYGRPEWSEKNRYLDWLYHKITFKTPEIDLQATIDASIDRAEQQLKYLADLRQGKGHP